MSTRYTVDYVDGSGSLWLEPGEWMIQICAATWGGSTVATLQSSSDNSTWVAVPDPYNSGSNVTRSSDGAMLVVSGGAYYRLSVADIAGSSALELRAHRAGR